MKSLADALSMVVRYGTCDEGVTRRDEFQPCDKTAVAMRNDPESGPYPVCAYHSRGDMVPLTDVLMEAGA